jgi:hypothetical protein
MIDVRLADSRNKFGARVSEEGTLHVINHGHPPQGKTLFALPFRERMANSAGSTDMTVDGSVTEVEFYSSAETEFDVYIRSLSVEIGDSGSPTLNKFGALSALSNGVEMVYITSDLGEFTLHEGIKDNKEFIRIGVDTFAIGTGTDAFLADVSGGASTKSYLPVIDIQETYGLPFGLKFRKGSEDRLVFRVRDDLTGLDIFDVIAYGIKI